MKVLLLGFEFFYAIFQTCRAYACGFVFKNGIFPVLKIYCNCNSVFLIKDNSSGKTLKKRNSYKFY